MAWASLNKMAINFQKTKEIVFYRRNPRNIVYPAAIGFIEQVDVAKLLGVLIQCNFCLLYTSPSPRDRQKSRMPSSA